jgi:hypothetical protein
MHTFKLLIDSSTGLIATPDIQREAGCDAEAAWRFPLGAMTAAVTPEMGIFKLSDERIDELVQHARHETQALPVLTLV